MMNLVIAKWLMAAGTILLLAGLLLYLLHDKLQWLGKLPGDLRFERGGTRFYLPLATMLISSLLLTRLLNLLKKLFYRWTSGP